MNMDIACNIFNSLVNLKFIFSIYSNKFRTEVFWYTQIIRVKYLKVIANVKIYRYCYISYHII